MNNFIYDNGTRIIFGAGCVKEYLASFLRGYGPQVLLVTDRKSAALCDARDEVDRMLRDAGKNATEHTICTLCPNYKEIRQATRLCREHHVDLILGVGGSVVLDFCKEVSLAAVCRGELWQDFWLYQGVVDIPPLPVGFVSTGIEVGSISGAAVLAHGDQLIWREYPPCDPKFALLDPAYTKSLSSQEIIIQAFSAFAGAMEQYLAPARGAKVSHELLETLLRSIVQGLDACRHDLGDDETRSDLMWACSLCGSRLLRLGRCCVNQDRPLQAAALRAAAETGGKYADALAVLLMARCRQAAEEHPGQMAQMARRVWELPEGKRTRPELAQDCLDALEVFLEELGLPVKLPELENDQAEQLTTLLAAADQAFLQTLIPFLEERKN